MNNACFQENIDMRHMPRTRHMQVRAANIKSARVFNFLDSARRVRMCICRIRGICGYICGICGRICCVCGICGSIRRVRGICTRIYRARGICRWKKTLSYCSRLHQKKAHLHIDKSYFKKMKVSENLGRGLLLASVQAQVTSYFLERMCSSKTD